MGNKMKNKTNMDIARQLHVQGTHIPLEGDKIKRNAAKS